MFAAGVKRCAPPEGALCVSAANVKMCRMLFFFTAIDVTRVDGGAGGGAVALRSGGGMERGIARRLVTVERREEGVCEFRDALLPVPRPQLLSTRRSGWNP